MRKPLIPIYFKMDFFNFYVESIFLLCAMQKNHTDIFKKPPSFMTFFFLTLNSLFYFIFTPLSFFIDVPGAEREQTFIWSECVYERERWKKRVDITRCFN